MQNIRKISRIENKNFNSLTTKKFLKSNELSFEEVQTEQKDSFDKLLKDAIENIKVET